jgi:hypothetical protein
MNSLEIRAWLQRQNIDSNEGGNFIIGLRPYLMIKARLRAAFCSEAFQCTALQLSRSLWGAMCLILGILRTVESATMAILLPLIGAALIKKIKK